MEEIQAVDGWPIEYPVEWCGANYEIAPVECRPTHFIRSPPESISGFTPKFLTKDYTQFCLRGFERLGCPRRAKTASLVCAFERGASSGGGGGSRIISLH
jgi:hypothetical protein